MEGVIAAAERRKNVATGASPWIESRRSPSPVGGERFEWTRGIFRPSGAGIQDYCPPGLAPGATFLCRSAAKTHERNSNSCIVGAHRAPLQPEAICDKYDSL